MITKAVSLYFFIHLFEISKVWSADSPWAWRCVGKSEDNSECIRERKSSINDPLQLSLSTCKLICGKYGTLVPKPTDAEIGKNTTSFLPSHIKHTNVICEPNICLLLTQAVTLMVNSLEMYHPNYTDVKLSNWTESFEQVDRNHTLGIFIHVNGTEEYLSIATDESYSLNINTYNKMTNATIIANTFFGARHALETLSQLIDFDEDHNTLQVVSFATIRDSPVFKFRSFILDTSRNFISVKQLKKVFDGMSYNKLNNFHWHITDSHSFPLQLNTLPKMAIFGAYSPKHIYSTTDVEELVRYARLRGIRIIPEIDAPAHVGHGWEWGEEDSLGKLVVCLNKQPWRKYCLEPPCGQLNLANDNIYYVLGKLYDEIVKLFNPLKLFHYGGDEVHMNCWNTSTEMVNWMTKNGFSLEKENYIYQWSEFQEKARLLMTKANNDSEIPGILWTSDLTTGKNLDKYLDKNKYIISIWTRRHDPRIAELLQKGYRVIFSNFDALYFDCGAASWVNKGNNWCSPYNGWQEVYDNDIYAIARNLTGSEAFNDQILGAEAAVWTEQIDDNTLDSKLWPRGSALAERLWSNPKTDYAEAEYRILQQRHRLMLRGLNPERLQPEWCRQNQGQCRDPNWVPSQ